MENELQHHGVIGMRWGVRRYQNKDGSLTKAGQKRYNAEMEKVKAETKKVKNQQRTAAKISKLEAAKKNLEDLKKGKKSAKDDTETDEQKRERILKNPTPKDVYENKHLFSNKEVGDLYVRLNNEENIKRLMPKEIDEGKAKADKAFDKIGDLTTKAITLSKAYNAAASIINAFNGSDSISLPKIDVDNVNKGNKQVRKQEKKMKKEAEDKAAKEAKDAAAKEKYAEDMKKYEEFQRQYAKSQESSPSSPYHNEGTGRREYANPNDAPRLTAASTSRGKSSASKALAVIGNDPVTNHRRNPNEVGYIDEDGRFHAY